jgi:NADH-quinone oxidoreductase subunit H
MASRGSRIVEFRFGNFVASLIWLILIVLIIVSLAALPLIFIVLFYAPLPPINGQVLTPYLFLSMMVDPTRTLPVLKFIMHTELFRVAVFPGFSFAAIFAAVTIFVERKFLAKMQLRVGPLYQAR